MGVNLMFIVGLPRSRTAWLSVFMSQSKTYFHHEAINGCYSIREYKDKITNCGDSTTAINECSEEMVNSKVVIIKKDKKEISELISWCDKEYAINSKNMIEEMDLSLEKIKGLIIKQSDIDSRLKDIWEYLVNDEWHDKYADMTKFNIQVKDTSIDEIAAKALYETLQ